MTNDDSEDLDKDPCAQLQKLEAERWGDFRSRSAGLLERRDEHHRHLLDELPGSSWNWHIRRAARFGTRVFEAAFRNHPRPGVPLRSTQFDVLSVVRYAGARDSIREIARRLGVHRTTLSHSLARLERLGFVRRTRLRGDGRRRPVELTENGQLALRMNVRQMWTAQVEMGQYVKDGFDGIPKMFEGIKRHCMAARIALYHHHDLRPEMFNDRPPAAPRWFADSVVPAQRHWGW